MLARGLFFSPPCSRLFAIIQVVPNLPLIEHYTIDVDALLARAAKSGASTSGAQPSLGGDLPLAHALFKRLRGHQIDFATDELLAQATHAACFTSDPSTSQPLDSASATMHRLKQAAVLYNASAALHLSDDLKAASDSISSSLCAEHVQVSTPNVMPPAGAIFTSTRLAPAAHTFRAPSRS